MPCDPGANYRAHREEITAALNRVLTRGHYVLGPEVAAFEEEFARYLGVRAVVAVANGTDALHLALRAAGVGPGEGVVTVSHTAVATVAAIELAGAVPVLVDIDPVTYTLDPTCLDDAIRAASAEGLRVRAVVPVHLYGQAADMPAISSIAAEHGLTVIEDCAQSTGASLHGRPTGTWGQLAAFSFYPTKNLGAIGDGGAVATDDLALAEQVRQLRQYGWGPDRLSERAGLNSRLDELQAAVLRVKLHYLDAENQRRRSLAGLYDRALAPGGLGLPAARPGASCVYHQYVIRSPYRDGLRERLRAQGVATLIHYPVPVHLQPAYRDRMPVVGSLPQTCRAARQVLSLPMYPELPDARVLQVAQALLTPESDTRAA